ncbi:HTH-type transcriptional activator RhaS [bacterium HR17]|uniref:HTH-type transcriptional activator RhaS n=1 Tax=Candidatus Fervidibacter japonicus TaxID=2035412 RepID=A0A2H5XGD9_9BACT|nr:HTH-type transcriptional activator RhaS [bacterium HR17]
MGMSHALPTVLMTDGAGSWEAIVEAIERHLLPRLETLGDSLFAVSPQPCPHDLSVLPVLGWSRTRRDRVPLFVFVFSGQGQMLLQNYLVVLKAGHGVFMPSNTPYAPYSVNGDRIVPCDWLWVRVHSFGVSVLRARLSPQMHSQSLHYTVRDRRLVELFQAWEQERSRPNANPIVTKGLLCAFFGTLIRSAPFLPASLCPRHKNTDRFPPSLCQALMLFHSRYDKPLCLTAVAHECGVTPAHLCRLFRRYLAMTPWQYLERLRLQIASQLLRETALGIADIAFLVGFQDLRHFQRLFRRAFGVSPSAFRGWRCPRSRTVASLRAG